MNKLLKVPAVRSKMGSEKIRKMTQKDGKDTCKSGISVLPFTR